MDKFILRKAEPKDVSDILRLIKVKTDLRRMRITCHRIIIILTFKLRKCVRSGRLWNNITVNLRRLINFRNLRNLRKWRNRSSWPRKVQKSVSVVSVYDIYECIWMYDGYLGLFIFQSCSRTVSEIIRFITASSPKYRRINSLLKAS